MKPPRLHHSRHPLRSARQSLLQFYMYTFKPALAMLRVPSLRNNHALLTAAAAPPEVCCLCSYISTACTAPPTPASAAATALALLVAPAVAALAAALTATKSGSFLFANRSCCTVYDTFKFKLKRRSHVEASDVRSRWL